MGDNVQRLKKSTTFGSQKEVLNSQFPLRFFFPGAGLTTLLNESELPHAYLKRTKREVGKSNPGRTYTQPGSLNNWRECVVFKSKNDWTFQSSRIGTKNPCPTITNLSLFWFLWDVQKPTKLFLKNRSRGRKYHLTGSVVNLKHECVQVCTAVAGLH